MLYLNVVREKALKIDLFYYFFVKGRKNMILLGPSETETTSKQAITKSREKTFLIIAWHVVLTNDSVTSTRV